MPQVNPKVTNVAIKANGAGFTLIACSILASKVEVMEDPAYNNGAAQALQGYYMDPDSPHAAPTKDNPNLQTWLGQATGGVGQGFQPIKFGGSDGRVHGGEGLYVGAAGTPLLLLESYSANATGVIVTEWP